MEPKRVLIIDDEAAFTNLVKANLERTGRYQVRTENRPQEALAAVMQFQPAVILLDVVMPLMDGGQLLAELHRHEKLRGIPVILLTASLTQQVAKVLGGQATCRAVLAKPIDAKRLVQTLDEVTATPLFGRSPLPPQAGTGTSPG